MLFSKNFKKNKFSNYFCDVKHRINLKNFSLLAKSDKFLAVIRSKPDFYLLSPSPWPLFSSFAVFVTLFGFAAYVNYYPGGFTCFYSGLNLVAYSFFFWCRDIIRELNFLNKNSILIELNLKWAFWLFITSEACLFLSFFWAFFHSALEPVVQLGALWPPLESIQINTLKLPYYNTMFLLLSGVALTWVQYGVIGGLYKSVYAGFVVLFSYSTFFMLTQWNEYVGAFQQINDSVFGSSVYLLTLFHGIHVVIGSIFLFICFLRFLDGQFTTTSYLGLTLAAWYWHFVDVIWVLVFLWIYLWGNWVPNDIIEAFISKFTQYKKN